MDASSLTVRQLADELDVNPKAVRAWMRQQNWRHTVESGTAWVMTKEQADLVRMHFGREDARPAITIPTDVSDELAQITVGQLLRRYAAVLAELRHRGLVRTNNAPIGDLAEYCAAIVYDGLLAPNSEKSYDLVADDGRKVQVKVRTIRSDTSPSAVFSPIRSFGFDVCIFLLVDGDNDGIIAAREWTASEVQEAGKHRAHTNGTVVRVGQVRSASARGLDRVSEFQRAWQELTEQTR